MLKVRLKATARTHINILYTTLKTRVVCCFDNFKKSPEGLLTLMLLSVNKGMLMSIGH